MTARVLLVTLVLLLPDAAKADCPVDNPADDPQRVEFFEARYGVDIKGVQPLETYADPDTFYAEIAKQVGIPERARQAIEEKYGWKESDEFLLAMMIKGGGAQPDWGVVVTRFPTALKTAATVKEKKELLKQLEMKFVVIGYDGQVSFPEETAGQSVRVRAADPEASQSTLD